MRLRMTFAGVLVLGTLTLMTAIYGSGVLLQGSATEVGLIAFASCLAGMTVAHFYSEMRREVSRPQSSDNHIEDLVNARTRHLSQKIHELEQARAQAVEASAAKSRFLATMSHELRTPLNATLGFSEIIQRQMFGPIGDPRYVDYAKHIHDSGSHLLSLIQELLDLSKIEAGRMELACETLVVEDVIAEAQKLSRVDVHHALTVLVEDELPRLYVDKRATLQMLLNLMSNAAKFTPRGGAIAVTAMSRSDGGVTLAVRDSGIGIAKADIPKALAAYSQVGNPEVRRRDGTGLGLPIVQSLITLHGGTLDLESEAGQGTSVSLHFPAVRSMRNPIAA
jgi:signal transduction histidine kinase